MEPKYIIIGIIALIIIILVGWLISTRNKFVVLKNRVQDQKSQVDIQLKRRYDLVPNLLETAKGYAGFEKSTLEAVTRARANAINAKTAQEEITANNNLTNALSRFIAISESYPDLKSSKNFIALQEELSATENKIALSRQFYNDTIMKYNNAIQLFPANIIASILGYKKYEYLQATTEEAESIRFNSDSFKM
ncbi:MAG: LemA family protein [Ruminococcus sp.]|nr:LemA family protein [Ruminococcus sp.]